MLTLLATRATARLRLNVKGLNMGDSSPWQSLEQGRRTGSAVSPHPILGQSTASIRRRASRTPEAVKPYPSDDTTLVLPSPRRGFALASQPFYRPPGLRP